MVATVDRVDFVHKHPKPTTGKLTGLPFSFHPKQMEFLKSRDLIRGFVGGRGAGKSYIGSYDMVKRAKADRLYLVGAPTYPMLRDATFRSFLGVAESMKRLKNKRTGNELWCKIKTFDPDRMPCHGVAEVIFRSTGEPDKFRGPNLSGIWMDECSVTPEESFDTSLACLREGGVESDLFFNLTFTPKGRTHWTYGVFFDKDHKPIVGRFLAASPTRSNPFLHSTFVDVLASRYNAAMQRQELSGEFIDAQGLLFSREGFKVITALPDASQITKRVRYWDKAATPEEDATDPDWSVGLLMARTVSGRYIIENIVRGRWSPYIRNRIIHETAVVDAQRYGNSVEIWLEQEPGSGGKESAIISIRELAGFPAFTQVASGQGTKYVRAQPLSAQCDAGNVDILINSQATADAAELFLDEMVSFPMAVHDDHVDAASGAFAKLTLSFGFDDGTQIITCSPAVDYEKVTDAESIITESTPAATADLLRYLLRRR
jgi:predicted phage terminase large subunit-like protein